MIASSELCTRNPIHDTCLMEEALHDLGRCTEYDHVVPGVYCPLAVCRRYGLGAMLPTAEEAS